MKTLIFSIVLSSLVMSVNAQTIYPTLGYTQSKSTMNSEYTKIRPGSGLTVGVGYNHPLVKFLSAELEINYVQKVYRTDYDASITQIVDTDTYQIEEHRTRRYAISYLEMPLLLKANLIQSKFFIVAGPSVAVGLGGINTFETDITSSYFDPYHAKDKGKVKFGDAGSEVTDDVYFDNRWSAGIQAGMGVFLFRKINLEVRYTSGISNLEQNKNTKINTFQVSTSVPLKVKK